MQIEAQQNHIHSLQAELTVISRAREKISKYLKERLPQPVYKEVMPEIAGVLMMVQKSLHQRILRLEEKKY